MPTTAWDTARLMIAVLSVTPPSSLAAQQPAQEAVLASSVVRVPMTLYGDRPVIQAMINGQGPFRLGVETGNPAAITLYAETAARLTLTTPDTANPRLRRADSATIGGLTLRHVDVAVVGPSLLPMQLDGQLGLRAYADLLITVDFPGAILTFSRDTLSTPDGATTLATRTAGPLIAIPVTAAGHLLSVLLDTQGATALALRSERVAGLPLRAPLRAVGMLRSPALGTIPALMGRLDGNVAIGKYLVRQPLISATTLPPQLDADGILGIHLLREFAVSLDQRTGRAQLRRGARIVTPPASLRGIGLTPEYGRGALKVLGVVPGSVAAVHDLRVGDVIAEINGRKTDGFSPSDWEPLAQGIRPLTLVVFRDGARLTRTLQPKVVVP